MTRYLVVWLALLALTAATVLTSRLHLPTMGVAVAVAIAATKSTLVALYFMHLRDQAVVYRVVLAVAMLLVAVLLALVLVDVKTRFPPAIPPGPGPLRAHHERDHRRDPCAFA